MPLSVGVPADWRKEPPQENEEIPLLVEFLIYWVIHTRAIGRDTQECKCSEYMSRAQGRASCECFTPCRYCSMPICSQKQRLFVVVFRVGSVCIDGMVCLITIQDGMCNRRGMARSKESPPNGSYVRNFASTKS